MYAYTMCVVYGCSISRIHVYTALHSNDCGNKLKIIFILNIKIKLRKCMKTKYLKKNLPLHHRILKTKTTNRTKKMWKR